MNIFVFNVEKIDGKTQKKRKNKVTVFQENCIERKEQRTL